MPLVRKRVAGALPALVYTMLLSGLWHGASFAFIFWGLFFGLGMVIERKYNLATKITTPYHLGRNVRTFVLIILSMPLFFTNDLRHSLDIYQALFGFNGLGSLDLYVFGASKMAMSFAAVALCWLVLAGSNNVRYYAGNKEQYFMRHVGGLKAVLLWAGFALALSSLAANSFSPFLYFQF
jgi:alginate O-acetyltransferase complex protein AlgI